MDHPDSIPLWAERREDGWWLRVRAQPGAGRSQVVGPHGDALKIALAAPANEGKANAELVRVVAEALGVPRREVGLRSGERSRNKVVVVPAHADLTRLTAR